MDVEINIEPGHQHGHHAVIEVPDSELEGLTPQQRWQYIEGYAQDYVNEEVSWGWEVPGLEVPPPLVPRIFFWDWKEQPPMDEIGAAVAEISGLGRRVFLRKYSTESDSYACIVADHEVSDEEAVRVEEASDEEAARIDEIGTLPLEELERGER